MRKRVFTVILLVLCTVLLFSTAVPAAKEAKSLERLEIDTSKPLIIDFANAQTHVIGWNYDYVKIVKSEILGKLKVVTDINASDNEISLSNFKVPSMDGMVSYCVKSWLPLRQIEKYRDNINKTLRTGFTIYVPKNTAVIVKNADYAKFENACVKSINASSVVIRDSNITEGFTGAGESITVRNSTIGGNCIIEYQNITLRECAAADIVLSTGNAKKDLDVLVREVTANEIKLDAKTFKNLDVYLRDSKLQNLTINSDEEDGDITVSTCTIQKINNNSPLKVKTEK